MTAAQAARLRSLVEQHRFLRFLLSGGFNTVATYGIYLALFRMLDYRVAYTIAYAVGILLSYVINWLFVFRMHRGWSSVLLFPFVYLAQYLAGLAVVWAWVDHLGLTKALAPLLAIAITIPLTYALSRLVFTKKKG